VAMAIPASDPLLKLNLLICLPDSCHRVLRFKKSLFYQMQQGLCQVGFFMIVK